MPKCLNFRDFNNKSTAFPFLTFNINTSIMRFYNLLRNIEADTQTGGKITFFLNPIKSQTLRMCPQGVVTGDHSKSLSC